MHNIGTSKYKVESKRLNEDNRSQSCNALIIVLEWTCKSTCFFFVAFPFFSFFFLL